jgi:hypothetical protein
MSTKTTFKRIALVTVAALGFGVMSVVPSNAATSADTLTLSSATASMKDSETSTATTATLAFYAGSVIDSMTVSAFVTSAPAGSTAVPQLTLAETSSAFVGTASAAAGVALKADMGQVAYVGGSAATVYASAKFNINMVAAAGAFDAGVKVGTYVLTLVPAVTAGGGLKNAPNVTLTITVTADPTTSKVATSATSIITTSADTTVATDATVTASKTAQTTATQAISGASNQVAYIKVTLKNASALTTTGESYTAVVKSGPGILGSGALTNEYATRTTLNGTANARGRAITVAAGDVVAVFGDGSSGVSTIEIQSALGVVLATETLTFFGDATTATATVKKAVIGTVAGGADAVLVKLADAATTNVMTSSVDFYVTSSDVTKISGNYTKQTATYDVTEGGYLIDLTPVAAGTASITIGTKSSATATTGVNAAAVSVRVGGGTTALDDVTVAFDKSSYLPGELATITVTPVDSAGLVLAASDTYTVFATGGIVAPAQLGTGSATLTGTGANDGGVVGAGTGTDAVATYKVYMPSYQGTFVFKYTTGTMATTAKSAVARTVSVDVISPDGGAAAAAAEEATAAANDATDAALSAAEAAEAATAMAQEAVDAVAELSASVTKLISALRAQITTLTNLVVKIQKKVKA